MDLFTILKLKPHSNKDLVKQRYYKLLFQHHPHNHTTGNETKYLELQDAYKRYISGDSFVNCFSVVSNDINSLICRCGGIYIIDPDFIGRMDCDFCSCFIEVETPIQLIEK
jgi:hypothetical protein